MKLHSVQTKKISSKQKFITGFTMVEVLVVIGIIAVLTVIIFPSINKIRAKNRDAEKVADLSAIQLALSLYFNQKGQYPKSLDQPDFSKYILSDSLISPNNDEYIYVSLKPYNSTVDKCTSYHLGVKLELQSAQIDPNDTFSTKSNSMSNDYTYCNGAITEGIDSEEPKIYHVHP